MPFYSHIVKVINGGAGHELSFESLKGKVTLIVNVASRCGYTKQYTGLEALHKKYAASGLTVIGFPCNQFGAQEPGTEEEIASFCSRTFNVSFPITSKIEVNGPGTHALYAELKAATGGDDIKWNFEKFLVGKDGVVIERFGSGTTPEQLDAKIAALL
ncbi:glutathione peroxidase [Zopfochytrium polystomum]|nr:glutathione peroxidase [Zopfochytrium polystomum]